MMKKVLLSVLVWVVGTMLTVLLYLTMLFFTIILYPFDKQRRVAHAQCYWWADAIISLNPYWKISVAGLENIDRNRTYVIVANHQSLADIVIVYKIKTQFKWVVKEGVFRVPLIGWCLALAKHIKLERGKFSSIKKIYREAAEWLRSGMSVLFFPEGTRSDTNDMKDFQNGAFKLAIKERVPVLPISIQGTGDAIPRGSWLFTAEIPVNIKVLPAVDTEQFKPADFSALRDLVRSRLAAA